MKLLCARSPESETLPKKSSRKRIYDEIKKAVIQGTIDFNQRLSEESLARLYGVSRTPVREAIFQLVQEGFVEKKDNSYFCVRKVTEAELEELAELRIVLHNLLFDKLMASCDDLLLQRLEQNVECSKKFLAEDDVQGLNYALSEFHEILYLCANSPWLEKILRGMVDQVFTGRALAMKIPGVRRMLVSDHEKILSAIKKRDKNEVKKRMREHLANTKKKALEVLLRDRLREITGDTN